MRLTKATNEFICLSNNIGEVCYTKDDSDWYTIKNVVISDDARGLYTFFKEVALHFKALPKEEEDF